MPECLFDPFGTISESRELPRRGIGETQLAHRCLAFAKCEVGDKIGRQKQAPSGSTMSPRSCVSSIRVFCFLSLAAKERPLRGPCSTVSASPRLSLRISISSARRSRRPSTTRTSASVPMATPGLPRSRRATELGEVPARTARSATVMLRRRRAWRPGPVVPELISLCENS